MKILLYGINFAPEPTGVGKYTSEMAEFLVGAGHQVRVVTAPPYYPQWKVGKGYKAWRYVRETWRGMELWRCPLWVPVKPGGKRRVLHLLSFAIASLPVVLRQALWRPDMVWVAAPAFACTPGALLAAKLCGAKAWLHVQDFEIDVAFDVGLLKGGLLRRAVARLESWLLRRFDVVSSISRRMTARAAEKGVREERIVYFPNWVGLDGHGPEAGTARYRKELGLADAAVIAMFAGTLGAKQGLHMIPQAAKLLARRCPQVHFVVCGDGVMKPMLEAAALALPNLHLLPLQPKERLGELLATADMHLMTQNKGVADLVMPSKLGPMLVSGRPVIATVDPGTEVAEVLKQCGIVTPPGDAEALAAVVEQLATDPERRRGMGFQAAIAGVALASQSVLGGFEAQCVAMGSGESLKSRIGLIKKPSA